MRPIQTLTLVCIALSAGTFSASAFRPLETNNAFPTEHQRELAYADRQKQPYALSYTDEAAQRLGIQDGRWEAFSTHSTDPLVPSFKGGIDSGAAMFKLQWQR